jgi:hypothetical protein
MAATHDFVFLNETTGNLQEYQLASGDTARLRGDSTRALTIVTEADADFAVFDTVASILTISGTTISRLL